MTKSLRFKKTTLLLTTLGMLGAGGDLLARRTLGKLHAPLPAEIDVPVQVVRGGALPERDKLYLLAPRSAHFEGDLQIELISRSKIRLITSEENYERLKGRPPLTLNRVESTNRAVVLPTGHEGSKEPVVILQDDLGGEVELMGLDLDDPEHEKVLWLFMAHLLEEEDD
ncbi:MAG: hypothetical protein ABW086_08650 [Sedimenticola sp.]